MSSEVNTLKRGRGRPVKYVEDELKNRYSNRYSMTHKIYYLIRDYKDHIPSHLLNLPSKTDDDLLEKYNKLKIFMIQYKCNKLIEKYNCS